MTGKEDTARVDARRLLTSLQLTIGHKRQSLTYGHYSQGERLRKELREYINRLRYSDEVMRLIWGRQGRKRLMATRRSHRTG
jgi:hypothetical protein